jgi:hypothetical protein
VREYAPCVDCSRCREPLRVLVRVQNFALFFWEGKRGGMCVRSAMGVLPRDPFSSFIFTHPSHLCLHIPSQRS